MGYFALAEFAAIEERGGSWLTRLPLTAGVWLEDGRPLEKVLKRRGRDVLDFDVVVGAEGKRCRLVAVRAAAGVVGGPAVRAPQKGAGMRQDRLPESPGPGTAGT